MPASPEGNSLLLSIFDEKFTWDVIKPVIKGSRVNGTQSNESWNNVLQRFSNKQTTKEEDTFYAAAMAAVVTYNEGM